MKSSDRAKQRFSSWILSLSIILIFFIILPEYAKAQTVYVPVYKSLAPGSVPRVEPPDTGVGTDDVGMVKLGILVAGDISVSKVTVELTGNIPESHIDRIRVYYEDPSGDGIFTRGGENDAIQGGATYTFDTGRTKTINLDPDKVKIADTLPRELWVLYIAFDFNVNADIINTTVGCHIVSFEWGSSGVGTGTVQSNPYSAPAPVNVDDYRVNLTATGIAPAEAQQSETKVGIIKLEFNTIDSNITAYIDSIRLHKVGTGNVSDISNVRLFDSLDTEITGMSDFLGDYITLDPGTNLQVTSTVITFFVAIDIAASAAVGKTVGLEIENPKTDIQFIETVDDDYSQNGYVISTSATPLAGNTVNIKLETALDTTPPVVLFTIPDTNEIDVFRNTKIKVFFSEGMDLSTLIAANFTLKKGVTDVPFTVTNTTSTSMTVTPDSLLDWETSYTATVKGAPGGVRDDAPTPNEMTSDYSWSFTTEKPTPPEVSYTIPDSNAVNVFRNTTIEVIFSEGMDQSTLTAANFILKKNGVTDVPFTVTNTASTSMTVTPDSLLDWLTFYTATVTTGVKDLAGTAMAANYSWSFTIGEPTPPTVLNTSPESEAKNIAVTTQIKATFSENIDENTVSSSNFSLVDDNGSSVSGKLSYSSTSYTMTFTPWSDLKYATTYTATITTGVTDLDGIPMQSDYSWSFTTEAYVLEPVAYNNRITPGSTAPVQIHIPEPDGGPNTKITIEVFTIKGQKVKTIVKNTSYSQLDMPLLWYGKNGVGKNLGPGLYFIQIRTESYKKVLKVLIVR